MIVLRIAPQQSWTNPAERVMSVLNLGLQGCSLARTAMDNKFEVTMRRCNGMNAICRAIGTSRIAASTMQNGSTTPNVDAPIDAIAPDVVHVPSIEPPMDDDETIDLSEEHR